MKKVLILFFPFFLFASVKSKIVKFYKSHYPNIEIVSVKFNKPLPKKYKKISFELANYKLPSSTVIIDNKYYFYRIKAFIKVYIATNVIRVNQPILPNAECKNIKFRNFYSLPLSKITPNLIASKIISKNSVINKSNTKIRPTVLQGESVSVLFEDPNIEIYAKGTALHDANAGETEKVKINGKIYQGIVNKNGEVIIK